jgi:hypothetical protein
VSCANKTPAIRDKAIHRAADSKVGVPAEINAIIPVQQARKEKTIGRRAYNMYTMSLYIGVESFYGKPQDS